MDPKANGSPRFSAERLAEILDLIKGSDSVELKLTIPLSAHRSTIRGLPIDPVETQPRQAFFFDTPDLDLNKAGIVVRARRIQGGEADTVVKLRPVIPNDLPDSLRRSPAFKVEFDALPTGYVCSGSLKGRSSNDEVAAAVAGEIPLAKILTKDQRTFYAKHAPRGLTLDKLVPLGPAFLLKSRFFWKRLDRNIVAEMWLYPDGSRILELSTKAAPEIGSASCRE